MTLSGRIQRGVWSGALLAALALPACGSSSTSSSNASGGGGGSSSASTTSIGGSVTVWAVWSGNEQANFQQVLNGFQQQAGVQATFASKGDQLPTVLGSAIAGGSPPDVAVLPQPGLLHDLVAKGALKPLDDVVGSIMDANFAPVWKKLGTDAGKLYGVYFKAANKSTVWYNVKTFSAAGVQAPKTYEEWTGATASTLKQLGVAPYSICGGSGWTLTDWFENVYLRTAGVDKYNQLAAHTIPWTDPSVVTAFTTMQKIFGDASNLLGGVQGAVSTPFPDCVNPVFGASPKAAQVYEGDFVGTTIAGLTGSPQPGTDFDYFPFPSINGSPASVSGGGDVAVMLKDTPQARALIQYLASPAGGAIWAKLGGFTSPNKKVDPSVYPNAVAKKAASDLLSAGDNVAFDMSDQAPAAFGGTAGSGEWADLQAWLKNTSDISGTTAKLEADAKAAYGH
jgi:alpha-glucoside transport system substrate-binding protein